MGEGDRRRPPGRRHRPLRRRRRGEPAAQRRRGGRAPSPPGGAAGGPCRGIAGGAGGGGDAARPPARPAPPPASGRLYPLVLLFALAMALQIRRTAREAARANREAEAASLPTSSSSSSRCPTRHRARRAVTAHELLDQGARRIETELRSQPEVRATLMQTMAGLREAGPLRARDPAPPRPSRVRRRIFGGGHLRWPTAAGHGPRPAQKASSTKPGEC